MYIDLNDKVTRFLVQEYVNKICHYASEEEIETCNKLFSQYDQVLLCEDGCYTLLK